ncbi:MAG: choice-of-anchor Q domain-containing protein [Anaerolineales bacterium]
MTYLSNSVLTAIGSGSSACSGTLQSSGHNIVSNILGCNFVAAAGDLQNVDPKLGPLFGTPAFFTLMPDSPAIDAGNPSGCNDHLGNPLLTDQRGSLRALDGNGDGVARCDIGAFEYDFDNPLIIRQVFLPGITRNYCANFFDDFNFQSGWPTGESEFVLAQYLNGEYRIQSKQPYLFLFRSPACERDNYVVEADMRWDGTVSSDIGLLFGLMPNFSQYYFVDIDPAYQIYALFRRNSNGSFSVIAPWTQTGAIRPGLQTNHLKVTRNGGQITLEINGVTIGSWFDSTITGPTRTGLAMAPYDDAPVADARFDNFRVTTIGAGTLGLPSLTPNHATGQPLPAEFQWHLPERELTFPQP